MEEDIKELTRLYDIAEVVLPKYSTEKIKYVVSEKQRISIKNILNRLKENEAVIDKATELLGDLKLSKDKEGYEVMSKEDWKKYFRKKVQNGI